MFSEGEDGDYLILANVEGLRARWSWRQDGGGGAQEEACAGRPWKRRLVAASMAFSSASVIRISLLLLLAIAIIAALWILPDEQVRAFLFFMVLCGFDRVLPSGFFVFGFYREEGLTEEEGLIRDIVKCYLRLCIILCTKINENALDNHQFFITNFYSRSRKCIPFVTPG